MGTLRKLKLKMKMDKDLRSTIVRSSKDEILIDVDGDNEADVALLDTNGDGDIDTVAIDLTGDGEFNLYLSDTDQNGVPDVVLYDEYGTGDLRLLGIGSDVEEKIIAAGEAIKAAVAMGEYVASALDEALDEMEKDIKDARKQLKKLS